MTDLEMTKLCAEAMGYEFLREARNGRILVRINGRSYSESFGPLLSEAQALALGKAHPEEFEEVVTEWASMIRCGERPNLNRMLCERIAHMQKAKR